MLSELLYVEASLTVGFTHRCTEPGEIRGRIRSVHVLGWWGGVGEEELFILNHLLGFYCLL